MSVTTSIRCDKDLRDSAAKVAEYYGFDLSSVTRAFWMQMSRTKEIPLQLNDGHRYKALWDSAYVADVDKNKAAVLPDDWEQYLD